MMGETAGILPSAISSLSVMNTGSYQQFVGSESLLIPWPYRRRAYSLTLPESGIFASDAFDTSSLPSSPLPFAALGDGRGRDSALWQEAGRTRDFLVGVSPSSISSGYCSESSESDSIPDSSSLSFRGRLPSDRRTKKTENHLSPHSFLPSSPCLRGIVPPIVTENNAQQPLEPDSRHFAYISRSQKVANEFNLFEGIAPFGDGADLWRDQPAPKLTTVSVPSKRSSSESSTSSSSSGELTSSEESTRRRVKDDEGFIRRAACVCVNEDESEVVLISSKNEGGGWLVPGGGLESGEEAADAAVREAWEEAGITGRVQRCLGVFEIEDEATHKKKRTSVYVLKVRQQHSVFPEVRLGRVRAWFSIDTAVRHLSQCKPHQIAYLKAL